MSEETHDPEALRWLVEDLAYHQARVLLLVRAVAEEPGHSRKLDGLTKLAKLDFLVRYPALAGIVLDDLAAGDVRMHLSSDEISAPTEVDDPMIRYRFGPWDDRYYPVIGALVSRGLLRYLKGRNGSVALSATAAGKKFADSLADEPLWSDVADRCKAVAQASVGLSGNALKERIYDRLAHLMDRPHREIIS
jgi:hypothetical protein